MSTVTNTPVNALTEAKRAYAHKVITAALAAGKTGTVVVLPEFTEENGQYVPTMSAAIPGTKADFGYVQLFSSQTTINKGWTNESELWAIQRGRMNTLERAFTAGTVLSGKIVREDSMTPTNAANPLQDIKYLNKDCQEAGMPCSVGNKPVYQVRYYTTDVNASDVIIAHDNHDALQAIITGAKARANNPQAGISGRKKMPTA